jgi:hypothetical protein
MKNKGLLAIVAILTGALSTARAGDAGSTATAKPVSNVKSNIVAEVRSSDNAFSLMIESYRQIQTMMIDSDYDRRVAIVNTIKDPQEHDRILSIANQEHAQRMKKLQDTLATFNTAYGDTRKESERKAGGAIASVATAESADEQLHHFVPFTPQQFKSEKGSDLLPVGAHMIYDDVQH